MSQMLDDVIGGLLFASGEAGPPAQPSTTGSAQATEDASEECGASQLEEASSSCPQAMVAGGSGLEGLPSGIEASSCEGAAEPAGKELPAPAAAAQQAAGDAVGAPQQESQQDQGGWYRMQTSYQRSRLCSAPDGRTAGAHTAANA